MNPSYMRHGALFLWVQLGYSKSYWCLVGNGGMTHNIPQLFSQSSQQPPLIIIDLQVIPSSGPIAIRKKTRRAFRSATSSFNAFVLRPPGLVTKRYFPTPEFFQCLWECCKTGYVYTYNIYMYTYIHTYIYIYIHIHTYTYTYTYI